MSLTTHSGGVGLICWVKHADPSVYNNCFLPSQIDTKKTPTLLYQEILIEDTTVYLAQPNCTSPLAWFLTQRLTEHQLSVWMTLWMCTLKFGLHFFHVSMHSMHYAYDVTHCCGRELIFEGMACLNFVPIVSYYWSRWWTQKRSENRHKLKCT